MGSPAGMPERDSTPPLVCRGCEKPLELCCFCDRDDCSVAVCFKCEATALLQWTPPLHAHGG